MLKILGRIHESEETSYVERLGNRTIGDYSLIRWNYAVEIYNHNGTIKPPVLYLRHVGQQVSESISNLQLINTLKKGSLA